MRDTMHSHTEPEWMSEKSTLFWGRGTTPGSEHTAFKCAIARRKTMVLKKTTWNGPHKLKSNEKKKNDRMTSP
jgi:hypothetical protein